MLGPLDIPLRNFVIHSELKRAQLVKNLFSVPCSHPGCKRKENTAYNRQKNDQT